MSMDALRAEDPRVYELCVAELRALDAKFSAPGILV
jgi:hypothetical protein